MSNDIFGSAARDIISLLATYLMQSMGPMDGNLNRKGPTGPGRAHDSHRIPIRGVYAFRPIGSLNTHPRPRFRLSRVIGAELDRRFKTKTKSRFGYCGSQKATKTSRPWVASALVYVLSKYGVEHIL